MKFGYRQYIGRMPGSEETRSGESDYSLLRQRFPFRLAGKE